MRTQLILKSTPDGLGSETETEILHKSVLLKEVSEGLNICPNDIVYDGTLGLGGHALRIIPDLSKEGCYIGVDLDADSISVANERVSSIESDTRAVFIEGNFKDVYVNLQLANCKYISKALLDLGWNQNQFELSGKGFSFQKNEPLNMSFGSDTNITAEDVVNEWSQETLVAIFEGFAEERFANPIAKNIVARRKSHRICTTFDLIEIIKESVPSFYRHRKTHFATKVFQALRIAVNSEFDSLKEGLKAIEENMISGGRIAVISFHSLEDRIVKNIFRDWTKKGLGVLVNKKPLEASEEELKENRRARSAKLRIYEKI